MSSIATRPQSVATERDDLQRGLGILCLLGVALIHLIDFDGKWHEVKYLAVGYLLLIGLCLISAGMLFHRPTPLAWRASAAIATGALIAFVLNRTIGLPKADQDIGNWAEPLGVATLFAEVIAIYVSVDALRRLRSQD